MSDKLLVEIPKKTSPSARRRIREAARRSRIEEKDHLTTYTVRYEKDYLVVKNTVLGWSILDSLLKDLGGVDRVLAYWLEHIPFTELERRFKNEEDYKHRSGMKRFGKNIKGRWNKPF